MGPLTCACLETSRNCEWHWQPSAGHPCSTFRVLFPVAGKALQLSCTLSMLLAALCQLQVDGTLPVWQQILVRTSPVGAAAPPLTPPDVLALVPVAHKYDIGPILEGCLAAASSFSYVSDPCSPLYPIPWLKLADRLHLVGANLACILPVALGRSHC